jgi:hypothetical protein
MGQLVCCYSLVKLLRVLRGLRIFARLEARFEINYAMLNLQQFIAGLVVGLYKLNSIDPSL